MLETSVKTQGSLFDRDRGWLPKWVTAAEPALGWTHGAFMESYAANRQFVEDAAIEGNPIAEAILNMIADHGPWSGTATELLQTLIDGADPALARRLILLPFKNVVPEADRDPALGQKLEAEASGILNLLLEGLSDYLQNGLAVPEELKVEAAAFVISSDMVASFLDDEIEEAESGAVGAKALYERYKFFCGSSGLRNLSMPQFRQELFKKGYSTNRTKAGQTWQGLRLRRLHTHI